MGDFNGDLGNSLGDKGKREPNLCGLKLLDFASCFNLCPVNLMKMCTGPLKTFNSYCRRFHSTLDYIFYQTVYRTVSNQLKHLMMMLTTLLIISLFS